LLPKTEQECLEEVRERFFVPLGNAHWEGAEVAKHRNKLVQQHHTSL
jgi:hypothetical protein